MAAFESQVFLDAILFFLLLQFASLLGGLLLGIQFFFKTAKLLLHFRKLEASILELLFKLFDP